MKITKEDIGKRLYFIEPHKKHVRIHLGTLVSVLPKYQFKDQFSSEYSRESNYLFNGEFEPEEVGPMVTTDPDYIFESLDEATQKCLKYRNSGNKISILYGYSVVKMLKNGQKPIEKC